MHEPSVAETVRAIREYLRKNPNAQDTQAGILHWWLTELPTKPRDATVKQALEDLVHDGWTDIFRNVFARPKTEKPLTLPERT